MARQRNSGIIIGISGIATRVRSGVVNSGGGVSGALSSSNKLARQRKAGGVNALSYHSVAASTWRQKQRHAKHHDETWR